MYVLTLLITAPLYVKLTSIMYAIYTLGQKMYFWIKYDGNL